MSIGIIGFGRLGGVLAQILKKECSIQVYDIKDKARQAKELGVIWADLEEVCKKELLILAVPISEMENVLKQIKEKVTKETVVMDTCSVKEYPAKIMKKILSPGTQILLSHPMFGPDTINYGLKRRQMVFCAQQIEAKKFKPIRKIFKNPGLKIIETTPKEHDKQTALSLCLVHFIGRALDKINIKPQQITTLGFERMLKSVQTVTGTTWQLFQDMHKYNRFAAPLRKKLLKATWEINKELSPEPGE